ncbi:MAG: UvrB/UvrC motif-containing protein [Planctomycetota bacterium]|nr:UvrB/UvrC motif-containing protein [Planctomycetota bacterium]MDA1137337.1 UvrB/UvrC motif-containing protein [Planctomycetota bacterium]
MSKDLESFISDWPYNDADETDNVRLITGLDGQEKIQIRIPCGLIQWEADGRPDGERPHGHESLLDYLEDELIEGRWPGMEQSFKDELNQEIMAYYARRVAFFRLSEFDRAKRDAEHNLQIMNLVRAHSDDDELIEGHEKWRPFLMMDLTRATALGEAKRERFFEAIDSINDGIERIRNFYEGEMDSPGEVQELRALEDLKFYLRETHDLGLTPRELIRTLEDEKSLAIEEEDFERASELNQRIKTLQDSQNY